MLEQILTKFLILNDVQAAIVIQANGEIIQSMKSGLEIDENLQQVISGVILDSIKMTTLLDNTPLSMLFVEFSDHLLILGPVREDYYLAILAKNTANLGQITYEMKKNQNAIMSLV